jgi:hypothetical protein
VPAYLAISCESVKDMAFFAVADRLAALHGAGRLLSGLRILNARVVLHDLR